jgi:protein O-GlcNAcase/histone acetyltransferase
VTEPAADASRDAPFISGVIEGFYGQPWTRAERLDLFERMAAWGLDTYYYAPKDDLHHRVIWREPYPGDVAMEIGLLVLACAERGLQFVYGIGPGLDIRYGDDTEIERLRARFEQMLALGCRHFSLLFDDIPDRADTGTPGSGGSLASAQCQVVNTMFAWLRARQPGARLIFCPTPYCGRMAAAGVGGAGYLETVGRELLPGIDVAWTGPEIISRDITVQHVRDVARVLGRKPLIWDNLHANDYDGRRFFCGPYAGRPLDLRHEVSGILVNPNSEYPLNYVPLRTFAWFLQAGDAWDARKAYLAAMAEWQASFDTVSGAPLALADLILFGDCFYLPYEEGAEAQAFLARARALLGREPAEWSAEAGGLLREMARLREVCGALPALRDRGLFHALSRRVWDLREELALLERYVTARLAGGSGNAPVHSDFHLPGTFRGGIIARLQQLLVQHSDGSFAPAGTPGRDVDSRKASSDRPGRAAPGGRYPAQRDE